MRPEQAAGSDHPSLALLSSPKPQLQSQPLHSAPGSSQSPPVSPNAPACISNPQERNPRLLFHPEASLYPCSGPQKIVVWFLQDFWGLPRDLFLLIPFPLIPCSPRPSPLPLGLTSKGSQSQQPAHRWNCCSHRAGATCMRPPRAQAVFTCTRWPLLGIHGPVFEVYICYSGQESWTC